MIERYTLPEMGRVWSEAHKYELWGKVGAIWIFLAFNATFMNFFVLGLRGMNRWVGVYPSYLANENLITSIAAFVLGAGFLSGLRGFLHRLPMGGVDADGGSESRLPQVAVRS